MFGDAAGSGGATLAPTTIDENIEILGEFGKVLADLMCEMGLGKDEKWTWLRVAAERL